jgi:hypothetical protein
MARQWSNVREQQQKVFDDRAQSLIYGRAAPPPSRAACSRSRRNTCFNFANRQVDRERPKMIDSVYRNALATEEDMQQDDETSRGPVGPGPPSTIEPAGSSDDLTRSFVRLCNLSTCPLDRLSRYEATLWRRARQVLFTLQCLDRRKPWERRRLR